MLYCARLGAVTHASQTYEWQEPNEEGKMVTRIRRDSTGKPPGNLPPHLKKAADAKAAALEKAPQQETQLTQTGIADGATPGAQPESGVRKQKRDVSKRQTIMDAIDDLFRAVRARAGVRRGVTQKKCPRENPAGALVSTAQAPMHSMTLGVNGGACQMCDRCALRLPSPLQRLASLLRKVGTLWMWLSGSWTALVLQMGAVPATLMVTLTYAGASSMPRRVLSPRTSTWVK